ncbi:MAG: hypothetical protein LPK85_02725 [Gammaproteobacteria bacterium]|nr:hypothetical protein [Gammaproteobacteria bacterium]
MTAATHPEVSMTLDPAQVRRGRRTALLLFTVGFGPMLMATLMYVFGVGIPANRVNHGELILPPQTLEILALQTLQGEPLRAGLPDGKTGDTAWRLVLVAPQGGEDVERLRYLSRQVHVALGRESDRVVRALALPVAAWDGVTVDPDVTPLTLNAPTSGAFLYLVDPLGNLVLRYDVHHSGKAMLADIKRLLKLSGIG